MGEERELLTTEFDVQGVLATRLVLTCLDPNPGVGIFSQQVDATATRDTENNQALTRLMLASPKLM